MARQATIVDLFSGAGGFSLGFQTAGCHVLAAVDIDEAAGATYRANFETLQAEEPPLVFCGDNGNLEELDLPTIATNGTPDILIGGPPCQGFSRIGRAKLDSLSDDGFAGDARNSLYRRFMAAAKQWQPAAVVMENVPGMLSVDGRSVADEASHDLVLCGYRTGYAVLNSSWYGVPQFRERLFFLGIRRDLGVSPSLPRTTHVAELPAGYVAPTTTLFLPFADIHHELSVDTRGATLPATTVGDALGDLPPLTDHLDGGGQTKGDFRRPLKYGKRGPSAYGQLMRHWPGMKRKQLVDHVIRRTPRDYGTFRRMKSGDRYPEAHRIANDLFQERLGQLGSFAPLAGTDEYAELQKHFVPPYPVEVFRDKWRKLIANQPSWTVPAHLSKDAYSHIHYDSRQARAISVREAARIQSFPDGFEFVGNMGDCFRQIGNAVPPLLAWHIAAHLLQLLGFDWRAPYEYVDAAAARVD